jgi:uncharacterized protein YuzB (UPF0349 family)
VIIQLCKKAVDRIGGAGKPMLSSLRDQEHSVVLKDCLDRCLACDKGLLIATVDGMAISALTPEKLLATVATMAEDE